METLILPLLLLTNLGLVFALALRRSKAKADEERRIEKILERARKKSQEIITKAYEKAVDVHQENKEAYRQACKIWRREIAGAVSREIDEFKSDLEKETFAVEADVKEKISQDYLNLERELEAYKAKKMQEIEGLALKIAKDAVYKFLGKSISLEQHRDLIVKSLEEAKAANVFS